jgi:hypothetical protein
MGYRTNIYLLIGCFFLSATSAEAKDFGSLPICKTLKAMPKGYIASKVDCDTGQPMQDCTFRLKGDTSRTDYIVSKSVIIQKTFRFEERSKGPFALRKSDNMKIAQSKIQRASGKSATIFDDADGRYIQTQDIACPAGIYNIRVFFGADDKISEVSVSTLPVI